MRQITSSSTPVLCEKLDLRLAQVRRLSIGSELVRRLLCDEFVEYARHKDLKDPGVGALRPGRQKNRPESSKINARLHAFMLEMEARVSGSNFGRHLQMPRHSSGTSMARGIAISMAQSIIS